MPDGGSDCYESNRKLQSFVREAYQQVANPEVWHIIRTTADVADGMRNVDDIQLDIREKVNDTLRRVVSKMLFE